MTFTEETGALVTSERIRKGAAAMERAGFRLAHERPLAELKEDCPHWRRSWWEWSPWHVFGESIPGEQGRGA